MSLHKVTETVKKIALGITVGICGAIVLTLIFRVFILIKDVVFPPKITPPNLAYGNLPPVQFPQSGLANDYIYKLNTISGQLPDNFPDRLHIYPIVQKSPNLLNLAKVKTKLKAINFVDRFGEIYAEKSLGNGQYEWAEPTGINRKFIFDTITFDFSLSSSYLASLNVLEAQNLGNEMESIEVVRKLLLNLGLLSTDIDTTISQRIKTNQNYNTYPKIYTIREGFLVPATSLSSAKVIRVDLYQKEIEYDLDTGEKKAAKIKMKLPILYPNPPYSTMSFWIGSSQASPEVYAADFIHRDILTTTDQPATYPLKTPQEAYEELKNGKAYISSYTGFGKEIKLNNIYLAYYLGKKPQKYLMPIVVFEGENEFFAYVSAVKNEWVK